MATQPMFCNLGRQLTERGPMTRLRKINRALALTFLLTLASCGAPAFAQTPRPPAFLAEHYDVTATLDPIKQSISAVTKIDFKAQEVSGGVRVEPREGADRDRLVVEQLRVVLYLLEHLQLRDLHVAALRLVLGERRPFGHGAHCT